MKKNQKDTLLEQPKRSEKAEETKARILQAAGELFLKGDYTHVTTDEIAKQANVGKGTIFLHFESKDKLATQVIYNFTMEMFGTIGSSIDTNLPFREVMRKMVSQTLKMTFEMRGLTQLILQLASKFNYFKPKETPDHITEMIDNIFVKGVAEMAEVFRVLQFDKPEISARLFFAIIDGLGLQLFLSHVDQNDPIVETLTEEITHLFSRGR